MCGGRRRRRQEEEEEEQKEQEQKNTPCAVWTGQRGGAAGGSHQEYLFEALPLKPAAWLW